MVSRHYQSINQSMGFLLENYLVMKHMVIIPSSGYFFQLCFSSLAKWSFSSLWHVGMVLLRYFYPWEKFTWNLSLFLICGFTWKLSFSGKKQEFCGCFMHFLAKTNNLVCRRVSSFSNPAISQAAVKSTKWSPRVIFRLVFWMFSIFLVCSCVRLEWKTTEQYSAQDLTKRQYISIKSSVVTPAYLTDPV